MDKGASIPEFGQLRPLGSEACKLPLVSAVVPTYNRSLSLIRAIGSIQRQTYPRIEIIVVDDCSSDNTTETVAGLCDARIRYLRHEKNLGGGAARNTGIEAASGDFITFLDDDDEWEPTKTVEQLALLKKYDVVVCTADGIGSDIHKLSRKQTLELADLRIGPFGGTGVLMAKASVLKDVRFDESLPCGQDWDLFIRIALKHKIGYLNRPLLRYNNGRHWRITNRVHGIAPRDLEHRLKVIEKHQSLFGARWAKQRMAHGMLYDFKYRADKMQIIVYVARRCGLVSVGRAFLDRVWARCRAYCLG